VRLPDLPGEPVTAVRGPDRVRGGRARDQWSIPPWLDPGPDRASPYWEWQQRRTEASVPVCPARGPWQRHPRMLLGLKVPVQPEHGPAVLATVVGVERDRSGEWRVTLSWWERRTS
jgi:hypothetical protein